ncbi:unnamed protein product, partial [Ilex paraguariensis]
ESMTNIQLCFQVTITIEIAIHTSLAWKTRCRGDMFNGGPSGWHICQGHVLNGSGYEDLGIEDTCQHSDALGVVNAWSVWGVVHPGHVSLLGSSEGTYAKDKCQTKEVT